jgi:hypothetical protein
MRFILFNIIVLFSGCLSVKKAEKQLNNINNKFPELIAEKTSKWFPCITSVETIDSTEYNAWICIIDSIKNSQTIPKTLLDSIKEKNAAMRDIISVSRQIVNGKYSDGTNFIEGFIGNSSSKRNEITQTLEAFEETRTILLSSFEKISEEDYNDIQRSYEISIENNKSMSANLSLYSFLNVIAIGLLFYIVTAK